MMDRWMLIVVDNTTGSKKRSKLLRLGVNLFLSDKLFAALLVNPAVGLDGMPVLSSKVGELAVDDMAIHEGMELVKVEEGNHGVAVVLGVEVGVPEDGADQQAGVHGAGVQKTVGNLRDLAVGVFQVAEEVDNRVPNKHWAHPPEGKVLQSLHGSTKDEDHGKVPSNLAPGAMLDLGHNATFSAVVPLREAPFDATVVNSDSKGRVDDSSHTHLEGPEDIQESHEVSHAGHGDIAESRFFQLFAGVVTGELRVFVFVVGVGVVLLVHHTLMSSQFEAKASNKEETNVVVLLGLEGIAVEELVLPCKCKGLELKAKKGVEKQKGQRLRGTLQQAFIQLDVQGVNGIGRQGHDGQVGKEAFEALLVRLGHQPNQDSIIENAIALLAFAVLDIGPVFRVRVHGLQAVSIGLVVQQLGELGSGIIFERVGDDELGVSSKVNGFLVGRV
jgi:citrate lyase gamma subunit